MANKIRVLIPANYITQITNVESITQQPASGATTIHFIGGDSSCFIYDKDITECDDVMKLLDIARSKIYPNISSTNPTGSTC